VLQTLTSRSRYLLNPYIFLPSIALSTSSFENTLMLLAIMFACQSTPYSIFTLLLLTARITEKVSKSLFALSFLLHLSLSSIVMLPPVLLLLITNPHSHLASPKPTSANFRNLVSPLGEFILYTVLLTLVSTLVAGSWSWIPQTWGATYVCLCSSDRGNI